jgi:signal recognition particle receptor subunit beta
LPLPQPVAGGAPGTQRFSFELDGLPSGVAAKGAMIVLTATAGADAIEVPVTLE